MKMNSKAKAGHCSSAGMRALLGCFLSLSIASIGIGCGGDDKDDPQPQEADASVITDSGVDVDGSVDTDSGVDTDAGVETDAGFLKCAEEGESDGLVCTGNKKCIVDSSGTPGCVCKQGYTGRSCNTCDKGYQDKNEDGTCEPNCYFADLPCETGSVCDDSTGTPQCVEVEWTFMVYMAADNNLGFSNESFTSCMASGYPMDACLYYSSAAGFDVLEMMYGVEAAGANAARINILVLLDESSESHAYYPLAPTGITRVLLVKTRNILDGSPGEELSVMALNPGNAIYSNNEADTSDVNTLKKFGEWTMKKYPAKRYALVLWDHGNGWRDGGMNSAPGFSMFDGQKSNSGFRGFATDDTTGTGELISISNGDYSEALAYLASKTQSKKLDLVGFDACLMGMYEVAAATEQSADFLVASPRGVPGYGWDYETLIGSLGAKPEMSAAELGKVITDGYIKAYEEDDDMEVVIGLYDMSSMSALNTKLDDFGHAMLAAIQNGDGSANVDNIRIIKAISEELPRFEHADHADLKTLADKVSQATGLPEALRTKAKALSDQVAATITQFGQSRLPDDTGMGIFFPVAFNCCLNLDDYTTTPITSMEEFEGCSTWAVSSFDCTEEGGAYYSYMDLLNSYETSAGETIVGDYYGASWWKVDPNDPSKDLTGWKEFLRVYYLKLFDVVDAVD